MPCSAQATEGLKSVWLPDEGLRESERQRVNRVVRKPVLTSGSDHRVHVLLLTEIAIVWSLFVEFRGSAKAAERGGTTR